MEDKKAYEKIIELNAQRVLLKQEIDKLRDDGVEELYTMGFSMDRICQMLFVAKVDVIKILHERGVEIRRRGRKDVN